MQSLSGKSGVSTNPIQPFNQSFVSESALLTHNATTVIVITLQQKSETSSVVFNEQYRCKDLRDRNLAIVHFLEALL